ncbi:probable disease resistance RPP8-like protein 2 [Primulina eburnea]|uniref:probable disease resistance RPP8-like protein 2 n=1 Tax=Primulina eburnea TaxID=1245227 RepID=UPI003C6C3F52
MPKEESWENILENISSTEPTIVLHCSKILCLSYDLLPLRLKPCFLYFAAYPEDFEIDVSKLIMLWVAEGFLKPGDQSKCLEDVGECYLEDLVNRSLILVGKKWQDGKLKTVGIHDMLREICMTKASAEEEGFLHHVSSKRSGRKDDTENPNRRLAIDCGHSFRTWPIQDSSSCSVFIFSERNFELRLCQSCRCLRILHAPRVSLPNFSDVISTFINLRYIAFTLNHTSSGGRFPTSISKLGNLQTIIAHVPCVSQNNPLQVPYEIRHMRKLRHLIMNTTFCLSSPSDREVIGGSDLRTLDTVVNFIFTEKSIEILVNLKKLRVVFEKWFCTGYSFNLNNLFRLQNLEELHVFVRQWHKSSMIWNHAFPTSLKELARDGVPLPW